MRALSIGQVVDRYVVEGLIGTGGVAVVYRVRDPDTGVSHALKVLAVDSPSIRRRIMREGRVQASLRHPNILRVTEVLDIGQPALVLELVEGPTLYEWMHDDAPLRPLADALRLFCGVVRGVARAHEAGLVHRDLKPGNVLLAPEPDGLVPKVADFGIVKRLYGRSVSGTAQGVFLGTPEYTAPEQIADAARVDHRADLFSLGTMLYEVATGHLPFEGAHLPHTLVAVASGRHVDPLVHAPDLPDAVVQAIRGLLVVEPADRIASCGVVLDLLRAWDDAGGVRDDGRGRGAAAWTWATPAPASGVRHDSVVPTVHNVLDETALSLEEFGGTHRVAHQAAMDLLALQDDERGAQELGFRYARALITVRAVAAKASALGLGDDTQALSDAMSTIVESGRKKGRPLRPGEVNAVLRGLDALLVRIEDRLRGRTPRPRRATADLTRMVAQVVRDMA